MEPTLATPCIAVVEDDPNRAMPLVPMLAGAGYRVVWYRQPQHLLDEVMEQCPDIVILASHDPRRFDRWHVAAELHAMGCAVIMATQSDAARREVQHVTHRGVHFVGVVGVPYDLRAVLATVRHALSAYPENISVSPTTSSGQRSVAAGVRHVVHLG